MSGDLSTIEFHGDTLFAVSLEGAPYVVPKPISDRLGLSWTGQLQRMKRDAILAEGMCNLHIPSPGGSQESTLLRIDLLNGWLFGISEKAVREECRKAILTYKRECYAALFRHFHPQAAQPDPIMVEHPRAFDDWTPAELNSRVGAVAEYRMSIGLQAGQWALQRLGFPMPPAHMLPRQYTLDLTPNP